MLVRIQPEEPSPLTKHNHQLQLGNWRSTPRHVPAPLLYLRPALRAHTHPLMIRRSARSLRLVAFRSLKDNRNENGPLCSSTCHCSSPSDREGAHSGRGPLETCRRDTVSTASCRVCEPRPGVEYGRGPPPRSGAAVVCSGANSTRMFCSIHTQADVMRSILHAALCLA